MITLPIIKEPLGRCLFESLFYLIVWTFNSFCCADDFYFEILLNLSDVHIFMYIFTLCLKYFLHFKAPPLLTETDIPKQLQQKVWS